MTMQGGRPGRPRSEEERAALPLEADLEVAKKLTRDRVRNIRREVLAKLKEEDYDYINEVFEFALTLMPNLVGRELLSAAREKAHAVDPPLGSPTDWTETYFAYDFVRDMEEIISDK